MHKTEQLIYHFKPYLIFLMGFICGQLEHPAKWISVLSLISASILIEFWRYQSRDFDYEHIELTD